MKHLVADILHRLFSGPVARYHHVSNEEHKIETVKIISFSKLAIFTVALPLCGFMFCIIWSLAYNFVESTSTHCGVQNYLPSVSASIGSFSPQKFVWRFTIAVHSAPRYLVSFIYYFLIHGSKSLLWLNLVEISALLGLTVVSSTEIFCKYNFIIKKLFFCNNFFLSVFHAYCFMGFIICSFFGMIIHLIQVNLWSKFKLRLFCINTISWIMALYLYVRHNHHCETGIYTLFALAEYIFVISNMIFHFQAYYDFSNLFISITDKMLIKDKLTV